MRRRKIRPSRRMPRPDRAPPLLLTLREKSDNPMQAPTERTAARPIARHCPGFKRARRRTALPEYRDKPAVFCFESSKSAALPSARAKPSFHGEARRECLRKITPGARLPATAPASSVPGAGQRSRNTRDKPAVFYSESSERRRAPRAPVPNSLFTAKPAGRACEKSRPAPTKPRRTLSSLAPVVFAMRRNCTKKRAERIISTRSARLFN